MLPDTKLILGEWDESLDAKTNLDRVRRDNLLGKASRSRVEDILAIFRQRYVTDPEVLGATAMLATDGMPAESLDRILYFPAAKSDFTASHCHLHLIPRRSGDVEDPTGGVRNIIPGKGAYR